MCNNGIMTLYKEAATIGITERSAAVGNNILSADIPAELLMSCQDHIRTATIQAWHFSTLSFQIVKNLDNSFMIYHVICFGRLQNSLGKILT